MSIASMLKSNHSLLPTSTFHVVITLESPRILFIELVNDLLRPLSNTERSETPPSQLHSLTGQFLRNTKIQ